MSLFDLRPIEPEPAKPEPVKPPQREYVVRMRQTKSGREIMVCTAAVAPPDVVAEAKAKGLPLFTGTEIQLMRDCLPEMVEQILSAKIAFPGCTVQEIINGDVKA